MEEGEGREGLSLEPQVGRLELWPAAVVPRVRALPSLPGAEGWKELGCPPAQPLCCLRPSLSPFPAPLPGERV